MRAAVLVADRRMEIREVPPRRPGEGEALLSPLRASVCGTDLHIFLGEFGARVAPPRILGHEFMGRVESAPAGSGFAAGDLVAVDPVLACRRCAACLDGRASACRTLKLLGVDLDGGLCEALPVPWDRLHRLPPGLSPDRGVFAELYAIAFHGTRRAAVEPGDTVVILGAGKLGLALLDVIRGTGAARVVSVDVVPDRLGRARRLGADAALDARACDPLAEVMRLTGGRGADRVIEAVGHFAEAPGRLPPVGMACGMVRPAGRVVVMGQGKDPQPVAWRPFVWKEAEIVASRVSLGEFPRAIGALAAQGRLHPEALVTDECGLDGVPAVLERMERAPASILKTIVRCDPRA